MPCKRFLVADHAIGPNEPCFVIAEAGVNHNGDLARALDMVDVAAAAGADAVKFQTFDADRLATHDAPKADYQIETTGSEESQHAMLARLQLSREDHVALARRCAERAVLFMSTPFDEESADLLAELAVPVFKIPSGEIVNLPFLRHVAQFGRPMIVSTGMADLSEVRAAVDAIRGTENEQIALLHCVSNYPAHEKDVNLRAMSTMGDTFGTPVGYSDHTLGTAVGIAAVALGACIIEKHFTLDRNLPGPDHRCSLEPAELRELVRGIRTVEAAMGTGLKLPAASEASTARVARKSLVAAQDLGEGVTIRDSDIVAKRPGTGLSPALRTEIVGHRTRIAIPAGTLLTWEMLS